MTESNKLLNEKIDELQGIINTGEILDKERAEKINTEIDKVQSDISKVTTAIEGRDGLDAVKEGVKATSEWNPYAAPILLVITIAESLGLFSVNKAKNTALAKQQADKQGREKTLREIADLPVEKVTATAVKKLMYSNIGEARTARKV